MPLSLKTMEVQTKRQQWNKRFRTVQVNRKIRIKPLEETLKEILLQHSMTVFVIFIYM